MESIAGKSYQYLMEIQIQDTEAPVCELYGKKWHSVDVLAMSFIPSLG